MEVRELGLCPLPARLDGLDDPVEPLKHLRREPIRESVCAHHGESAHDKRDICDCVDEPAVEARQVGLRREGLHDSLGGADERVVVRPPPGRPFAAG